MKKTEQVYQSLLLIFSAAVGIYAWSTNTWILLSIAVLFFIFSLFKAPANLFLMFWQKCSEILGKINNFILLGLLFFLILTPLGWLFKLFSSQTHNKKSTHYVSRNHVYTKQDFLNPW